MASAHLPLALTGTCRLSPRYARWSAPWLFRFVSTDGEISPPRWVRRRDRPNWDSDRSESLIRREYGSLSADLLSIVAWVESLTTSLGNLADRLLVPAAVVREVLDDTVRKGMVVRDGDLHGDFRLSLSPGERARPEPPPARRRP